MPVREDAKDWSIVNCLHCGRPFGQEETWMDNCSICFKERNGYKLLKGDLAFAALQYEVDRLRSALADASQKNEEEDADLSNDVLADRVEELEEHVGRLKANVKALEDENEKLVRRGQKARIKIKELEREVEALLSGKSPAGKGTGPDLALLTKMLVLCHPDRHQNSSTSTEVTKWLIDQRAKLKP